jgi:hypothetical protein
VRFHDHALLPATHAWAVGAPTVKGDRHRRLPGTLAIEHHRVEVLRERVRAWEEAEQIRAYCDAVERRHGDAIVGPFSRLQIRGGVEI